MIIGGPEPGSPPHATRIAVYVHQDPRGDPIGEDVLLQGCLHVLGLAREDSTFPRPEPRSPDRAH